MASVQLRLGVSAKTYFSAHTKYDTLFPEARASVIVGPQTATLRPKSRPGATKKKSVENEKQSASEVAPGPSTWLQDVSNFYSWSVQQSNVHYIQ